jgi:membrane dipeptidase
MEKLKNLFILSVVVHFAISCQMNANEENSLRQQADSLAQALIILDGHVDLPYRMNNSPEGWKAYLQKLNTRLNKDEFDLVRAREGGLDAPFMSIYTPAILQSTPGANKALADSLINMVYSMNKTYPDQLAMAFSPADVEQNFSEGKISLPLGMENGAPIGDSLENLAYFHRRGIRYITLTHSHDNLICDSSYDTTRTWNGLSPYGREVVKEMNRLGIMVDVSHLSDSAFYQVVALSKVPVIASHSSCRHFTPDFERNMSDDMIRVMAEKQGVIQINFGSPFLNGENRKAWEDIRAKVNELHGTSNDSLIMAYINEHYDQNPVLASVEKVADHIDHVVKLVGIDYVGLGSDFDGVGPTLPVGLEDVSKFPNLIYELLKRGYSNEDIAKITYRNVFRVWNAVITEAEAI